MQLSPIFSALLLLPYVLTCGSHYERSVDRAPQFASLPATAIGLQTGPGGYAVQSFGNGAYMVTEGAYQGISPCKPNADILTST